MAKSGFWMRGAKGKVAGAVFRKGKAGTTMAEYVKPKNPQTALQMAQRIIFATVAQAAKFMQPIIDHSFEGITDKQESLNHFKKINIARLRSLAASDFQDQPEAEDAQCFLTTKGISALIPNKYQVSDGTLTYNGLWNIREDASELRLYLGNSGAGTSIPVTISEGQASFSPLEVITALFGLKDSNEQFTACFINNKHGSYLYNYGAINKQSGYYETGQQIADASFVYGRLVLDQAAVDADTSYTYTTHEDFEEKLKSYFDMSKSSQKMIDIFIGCLESEIETQDSTLKLLIHIELLDLIPNPLAGTIIFSKLENNMWLRSKSFMDVKMPLNDFNGNNFGLYYNIALDAWFRKDNLADSRLFLSQGGSSAGNFN